MDGFEEKKWFVYMGDHHEGPFSLAEIQEKMTHGQVSSTHFVWAEGMGDWKVMKEVAEFENLIHGTSAAAVSGGSPSLAVEARPATIRSLHGNAPEAQDEPALTKIEAVKKSTDPAEIPANAIQDNVARSKSAIIVKWGIRGAVLLVIVALGGAAMQGQLDPVLKHPALAASTQAVKDILQPVLVTTAEKVPFIAQFISPIPEITDVSQDEYLELRAAASQNLEKQGPRIAIAFSKEDLTAPAFYIASNLPDGAIINIHVEGIADTLLNQMSASVKVQATIQKKLGKTPVIRFADGKPLPRGEYLIYAYEAETQPAPVGAILGPLAPQAAKTPDYLPRGIKLLANKSYFLNGNKDQVYAQRLKEFHEKLRTKATTELAEIKQLQGLLESQLNTTLAKFDEINRIKNSPKNLPQKKKTWEAFHAQWSGIAGQMKETFVKWTPDTLQTDYFYGMLYQLTLETAQTVDAVHSAQNSAISGQADPKAFEIQIGQTTSTAQTAMASLKAKIQQAESIPPSANGMPRREGL